ncbi:MAG: 5'/3'-nucleotidase SurE [Spirochaetes bacterium]|nr:5'/3'-nucleotidase SurE [Spirochaetota bacterium]
MGTMKNVLLSNDDGIESRGIWALKEHFEEHFNVFVVAPDRERSATGHSISLHDPIRLKVVEEDRVFAVNGTPVDAVHLALHGVVKEKIDVVVTGINMGLNLGTDVFYSGTISAASQAKVLSIPAVAVSIDVSSRPVHYETAAYVARRVVEKIDEKKVESGIILSVNVPNLEIHEIEGIEITRLGKRFYNDRLIEREDPKRNKYYWIEGAHAHDILDEGTDVKAVHERRVSITPLRFDITAGDYIDTLKQWNFNDLIEE